MQAPEKKTPSRTLLGYCRTLPFESELSVAALQEDVKPYWMCSDEEDAATRICVGVGEAVVIKWDPIG
jgi:hypothetical protein